ncbi:MAG: hydroxymyristoyl-ACP dehydratase [Rikenellaceae bacterium]|nr:hydroxymyristoyl-ACP dehydratase [Rikenellaceae bacterium]
MGIFEKALISGEELCEYIPQRAPFVMVDSYYGKRELSSYTGLTIKEENILNEGNFFSESGIIEHMAQSAAVSAGVDFKSRGESVPKGFIGAVSRLKINELPSVGKELNTTITEIQMFQGISLVSAKVVCEGAIVAEGELKIFLQENE